MSEENAMNDKNVETGATSQEQPVTLEDYSGMPGYDDPLTSAEVRSGREAAGGQKMTAMDETDQHEEKVEAASEESRKKERRFFHINKEEREFSREQWILTHIGDENLMEYLALEQRREETRQKEKDARQKRLLSAFQLAVSLAAIVGVTSLLRDNPTVLVNILYIIGIVSALWIWKNPKNK